jgi:L-threonylcarbamoyladenylate synthase
VPALKNPSVRERGGRAAIMVRDMAQIYDCSVTGEALTGMREARQTLGRGGLVVLPTDTVYGIAADAFNAAAVQSLLAAKGRGRDAPPPVLIGSQAAMVGLATDIPDVAHELASAFWPGGLTLVLHAQPSIQWDLGDTGGTVAIRVPSDPITLELLTETGPLAVSSANRHGEPSAFTAAEAHEQLGDAVAVYLENGRSGGAYDASGLPVAQQASTIVDLTALAVEGGRAHILRHGVIPDDALREILGDLLGEG